MNASELRRKLLYRGYSDVMDYLKDSPMNRFVYTKLLELRKKYGFETPILTIFNEIYYQCINAQCDRNPGLDIEQRYIEEETEWIGSLEVAELIFIYVSTIIRHKCELSFNDKLFVDGLDPLIERSKFHKYGEELAVFIVENNVFLPYKFEIMPCPIEEIPHYYEDIVIVKKTLGEQLAYMLGFGTPRKYVVNAWRDLTDNYNHKVIEWLVLIYPTLESQNALLERIKESFSEEDMNTHRRFMEELWDRVNMGVYIPAGMSEMHMQRVRASVDPDLDYDRMFAAGYNQTMEEAENDKEEKLKQERDTLKYQLEEQKKGYEAKMAERDAVFQAEMESMRKELLAKCEAVEAKHEDKHVQVVPEQPKAFSLTVAEMAGYVKEFFSEAAGNQFINMYYHFALPCNNLEDAKLMDEIIPAIHKRIALHQTFDMPNVQQFNNNPHQVINEVKEEDKD